MNIIDMIQFLYLIIKSIWPNNVNDKSLMDHRLLFNNGPWTVITNNVTIPSSTISYTPNVILEWLVIDTSSYFLTDNDSICSSKKDNYYTEVIYHIQLCIITNNSLSAQFQCDSSGYSISYFIQNDCNDDNMIYTRSNQIGCTYLDIGII